MDASPKYNAGTDERVAKGAGWFIKYEGRKGNLGQLQDPKGTQDFIQGTRGIAVAC